LSIFKSPFERLSVDNLQLISTSTGVTALAVSPGGALFGKVDEMVKLLKTIATNTAKSISTGGQAANLLQFKQRLEELKLLKEIAANTKAGKGGGGGAAGGSGIGNAVALKVLGGKGLQGIGKGLEAIVNAIESMKGSSKEFKAKAEALVLTIDSISKIGPAILKFAGYLFLATPLLLIGAIAAPLFGLALFIITKVLQMAAKPLSDKKTQEALIAMGGVGKAILILGVALVLASVLYPVGITALPFIVISLLAIGGVFFLLDKMGIDKSIKTISVGLLFASAAIVTLGISFLLFEVIINAMDSPYQTLLLIGALVLGIGLMFFALDKLGVDKSLRTTSIALMFAAGAIVLLGLAVMLVDQFLQSTGDPMGTLLMIGAMVGGVALVMYLAGKQAVTIFEGALVMIVAAIPIILLGLAVNIFAAAVKPDASGWTTIGQIGALVTGVGVVMGVAGLAAPFILAGAAAMVVAGLALGAVALGAMAMAKLFNGSDMSVMLGDSGHETEGFLGFGAGRMMSNMEWLMLSIARSFTLSPVNIASMYATAPAMIMVGVALSTVAYGIKKVQDLKIDYDVLPDQIGKLVTVLAGAFGAIGTQFPGGRKSVLSSIFGGGSQSAVADGIDACLGMGDALSSIAQGVQSMADLKFPIYTGTKITGYYTLSSDTFKKVNDNINLIVGSLSTTFGELGLKYPGGKAGFLSSVFGSGKQSPVADGIAAVMGMGDVLTSIAGGVQAMADLKFPIYQGTKIVGYNTLDSGAFDRLKGNIRNIVGSLADVFGEIGLQYPGGQKSFLNMIFGGGGNPVTDGIGAVQGMGGAVAEIAKGVQAMADLKIPIYKNGKIVGYESMGADAVTKVTSNIRSLVVAITGVMGEIGNNPDAQNDWGWFGSSKIEDGVEIVTSFADPIKKIADAAKTFMETNVDPAALNTKIQGIISGMTGALSSAGENADEQGKFVLVLGNVADKMKVIAENIDPWVKFVDNFKKYVDDMGRLKDTLNSFDKVNLKFTSDMFQGLAYLSGYKGAGSINQMSAALNESIKQLTLMIEEFKKSTAAPVESSPVTPSPAMAAADAKAGTAKPGAPAAPAGKPGLQLTKADIEDAFEAALKSVTVKVSMF
jgi:hypothetical protein